MKKIKFSAYLGVILMLLISGNVYAYSDIFYSVGTGAPGTGPQMELRTVVIPGNPIFRTLTLNSGYISDSSYSYSASDPIVGQYSSITTPYFLMSTAFSYQLRDEVGTSGVWNLTDQTGSPMNATMRVTNPITGAIYFQGDALAKTIDLVNGTIAWEPVSLPTFPSTLAGSETLSQLQYYVNNTILTSFKFAGSEALAAWFHNPSLGTKSSWIDYSTNVTVVPEPGEWALMIVGLGLIGFSVYRRQYRVALPEWQNVRKS